MRFLRKVFFALSSVFFLGCTTLKTGKSNTFVATQGKGDLKIGLLLAPSDKASLSYLGVLQALEQKRIKPYAIVGLEWGAFIGVLYSLENSSHGAQWALSKRPLPFEKKSLWRSTLSVYEFLNSFLSEKFKRIRMEELEVKFFCPSLSLATGRVFWQSSGTTMNVLTKCLAYPPWLEPHQTSWVSSSFSFEESYEYLRQKVDLVIFVEALIQTNYKDFSFKDDYAALVLYASLKNKIYKFIQNNKNQRNFEVLNLKVSSKLSKNNLFLEGFEQSKKILKVLENDYGF